MTAPLPAVRGRLPLILAIVAGALLLALVAVAFLAIGRGTADPGAAGLPSPTPSTASASPTPTDAPPSSTPVPAAPTTAPVDTSTRFTDFTADLAIRCDPTGEAPRPEITFSWTAANAVEAWYSPSDQDAKDDAYLRFPSASSGTQDDLTDEHLFPCNHRQYMEVTITLVGPDDERVSRRVVYEDVNWGS